MLDIFELSPLDGDAQEEINKGIMEEIVLAYVNFMMVWEEHKDEIIDFLTPKN